MSSTLMRIAAVACIPTWQSHSRQAAPGLQQDELMTFMDISPHAVGSD